MIMIAYFSFLFQLLFLSSLIYPPSVLSSLLLDNSTHPTSLPSNVTDLINDPCSFSSCDGCRFPSLCSNSPISSYNTILGAVSINPLYHFTSESPLVEMATRMRHWGSKLVKLNYDDKSNQAGDVDRVLDMGFTHVFIWWRSDGSLWFNGLNESNKQIEYNATYNYATDLIEKYKNIQQPLNIYFGHWEGDWYLLPGYNTSYTPTPTNLQGMADWLNVRQLAINNAKTQLSSDSNLKLYQYTEVNRVIDAMNHSLPRLVNKVLPLTNIDYVSYSSYDVQSADQALVNKTLDYINEHIPPNPNIKGKRLFVGEFGLCAMDFNFSRSAHELANREIVTKYVIWGVPFALYWEFYNNEATPQGEERGFWMIDQKNQSWPLYQTYQNYYYQANTFLADWEKNHGTLPDEQEFRINFAIKFLQQPSHSTQLPRIKARGDETAVQ